MAAEGLTVTELKERLEQLGIPTTTPNLVGEARFIELQLRFRSAQSLITKTIEKEDGGGTSRARAKIQGLKEVSSSYGKEEDEAEDMFHFDLGANLDEDDEEEEDDEGEEEDEEGEEDEEVADPHPSVPTPPPRSMVPPRQVPPPPTGPPPKSPVKNAPLLPTEITNVSKPTEHNVPPPSYVPSITTQKTKVVDDDDDNLSIEPDDEEKNDDEYNADREQLKEFCQQGKLQESLQDYDAAEYSYQQALRIDPLDIKTLTLFAVFLHRKRGEMDRAEAFFGRALQQCVPALFNAIVQSTKRKIQMDSEKAETCTSESKSSTNKEPISLGVNTLTTTKEGISSPNGVPGRNGNRIKNHDVVCLLLKYAKFLARAQGDVEGASLVYKKAVEIEPHNAFILGSAAHFLASESGNREEALTLYSRALKADPSNALHALWYAKLLRRTGQLAQAEVMYNVAIQKSAEKVRLESQNLSGSSSLSSSHSIVEASAICNYATFVYKQRKHIERSMDLFEGGLRRYPTHKGLIKNCRSLLKANPTLQLDPDILQLLEPKKKGKNGGFVLSSP